MQDFTGVRAIATQPPTIGDRRSGQPWPTCSRRRISRRWSRCCRSSWRRPSKSPVLRQVDADLKVNRPEGVISINRKKAAELGISVEEIGRTVEFAYSGRRFGYFLKDGKQYQVIAQMRRQDRNDPGDLKKLFVKTAAGSDGFVGQSGELRRVRQPGGDLPFQPRCLRDHPGHARAGLHAGRWHRGTRPRARRRCLPENFRTSLAGQSRDFAESSSSLLFAFLLALLIIYLVLAAQFESFRDPFIIILTVPLSVAGALLSLWLTGPDARTSSARSASSCSSASSPRTGSSSSSSPTSARRPDSPKLDAVLDASVARFRPILMTSLATIFGILPIALSLGASGGPASRWASPWSAGWFSPDCSRCSSCRRFTRSSRGDGWKSGLRR